MAGSHYVTSDWLAKELCDIHFLLGRLFDVDIEVSDEFYVLCDDENVALSRVIECSRSGEITADDIVSIANIFCENGCRFEKYRLEPDIIYDKSSGDILYMSPLPDELSVLMDRFVNELHNCDPSVVRAADCCCQLMTYWAFGEYTFSVGVCVALMILSKTGFKDLMLRAIFGRLIANKERLLSCFFELGSENYYDGRCDVDISKFIILFCEIIHDALSNDIKLANNSDIQVISDEKQLLMMELPEEQCKIIDRFRKKRTITSSDIEEILNVSNRQARSLCSRWMASGFLSIQDSSKRARRYAIGRAFIKYL